jgi:hypothetical protein
MFARTLVHRVDTRQVEVERDYLGAVVGRDKIELAQVAAEVDQAVRLERRAGVCDELLFAGGG